MLIILDNAESILDPRGTDGKKTYALVEELSRLETICLCITSRISTVPPECEIVDVPTLTMDAAQSAFYSIYKKREPSNLISGILEQLNFHPLSIALLATVAHQNRWSADRLTREWKTRRTSVLQTDHDESLANAIELSLASPLFQNLGPEARALLGVVAFFPQGVHENNLDWLFPTISNKTNIFDKFCMLSLTYQNDGFIMMLAPLRDYLSPKDPRSSPLLCTTKECYFTRMSIDVNPNEPNFEETRWITSEDVNVEYLLDVFTTVDANSDSVWKACAYFMMHLSWHKGRLILLKPKIDGLPDDHCWKPKCLFELSQLFHSIGNQAERKLLLTHALGLWREVGSVRQVALTLVALADANRMLGPREEGMHQTKEALGIYEQLGDAAHQAQCLMELARLLLKDKKPDAAEEATSRAINLLRGEDKPFLVCRSHRVLANIYRSKGKREKAIHHYEVALGIASSSNWHDQLFWVHYRLGELFRAEGKFDDAHAHIEHAKLHAANNGYFLGRATEQQARTWYRQRRLEEARSEALRAADIYKKFGVTSGVEDCDKLLLHIQERLNRLASSG